MAFSRIVIAVFGIFALFHAAAAETYRRVEETCTAYPKTFRTLGPIVPDRPHLHVVMRRTDEPGGQYFDVRGCGANRNLKVTLGPLADANDYSYNAIPLYNAGEFDLIAWDGDTEYEDFLVYRKSDGFRLSLTLTGFADTKVADTDKDGVYEFKMLGLETDVGIECPGKRDRKIFLKEGRRLVLKAAEACEKK
jgi:hypothetical protein